MNCALTLVLQERLVMAWSTGQSEDINIHLICDSYSESRLWIVPSPSHILHMGTDTIFSLIWVPIIMYAVNSFPFIICLHFFTTPYTHWASHNLTSIGHQHIDRLGRMESSGHLCILKDHYRKLTQQDGLINGARHSPSGASGISSPNLQKFHLLSLYCVLLATQ